MRPSALRFLTSFLVFGVILACEGDRSVPSGPSGSLELAGACKDATFVNSLQVWIDTKKQKSLEQDCKNILGADTADDAELQADALLVEIFNSYEFDGSLNVTSQVLQGYDGLTLAQAISAYVEAVCGLLSVGSEECPTPNDLDDDGMIEGTDLAGWGAWGPLFSGSAPDLAKDILPNGNVAFGVEDADGTFVLIAEAPGDGFEGDCPNSGSAFDCEDVYWLVDPDLDDSFTSIVIESDNAFNDPQAHMRCPQGGECTHGESIPEDSPFYLGLVGGTIDTKFGAFSPITPASLVERTREILCTVESQFNAGSEGTSCEVYEWINGARGALLDQCTTVASEPNSSDCSLFPPIPEDIQLIVEASKTEGQGAYNAQTDPLDFGPTNPVRGVVTDTCFDMNPPNATWNQDCQ